MSLIVYFSSRSENTHRFVERLGMRSNRIPMDGSGGLQVREPFVLVTPTYGGGGSKGAVPKPVIRFLNDETNRSFIRGVIAAEIAISARHSVSPVTLSLPNVRFPISTASSFWEPMRTLAMSKRMERFWTRQTRP